MLHLWQNQNIFEDDFVKMLTKDLRNQLIKTIRKNFFFHQFFLKFDINFQLIIDYCTQVSFKEGQSIFIIPQQKSFFMYFVMQENIGWNFRGIHYTFYKKNDHFNIYSFMTQLSPVYNLIVQSVSKLFILKPFINEIKNENPLLFQKFLEVRDQLKIRTAQMDQLDIKCVFCQQYHLSHYCIHLKPDRINLETYDLKSQRYYYNRKQHTSSKQYTNSISYKKFNHLFLSKHYVTTQIINLNIILNLKIIIIIDSKLIQLVCILF